MEISEAFSELNISEEDFTASDTSDKELVKEKYRERVKEVHPDVQDGGDGEKFKKVKNAKEELLSKDKSLEKIFISKKSSEEDQYSQSSTYSTTNKRRNTQTDKRNTQKQKDTYSTTNNKRRNTQTDKRNTQKQKDTYSTTNNKRRNTTQQETIGSIDIEYDSQSTPPNSTDYLYTDTNKINNDLSSMIEKYQSFLLGIAKIADNISNRIGLIGLILITIYIQFNGITMESSLEELLLTVFAEVHIDIVEQISVSEFLLGYSIILVILYIFQIIYISNYPTISGETISELNNTTKIFEKKHPIDTHPLTYLFLLASPVFAYTYTDELQYIVETIQSILLADIQLLAITIVAYYCLSYIIFSSYVSSIPKKGYVFLILSPALIGYVFINPESIFTAFVSFLLILVTIVYPNVNR